MKEREHMARSRSVCVKQECDIISWPLWTVVLFEIVSTYYGIKVTVDSI
jgi:hypothetical protein